MKLFYTDFTLNDLPTWEKKAKSQFSKEDYCSAQFLCAQWQQTKGWILMDQDKKWVGCGFVDFKGHSYNTHGAHFLELCIFPQFRAQGYAKYLIKIFFDYTHGYDKSACIAPDNIPSIATLTKYGFKKAQRYKYWDVYTCDKDYSPVELKNLDLTYVPVKRDSRLCEQNTFKLPPPPERYKD